MDRQMAEEFSDAYMPLHRQSRILAELMSLILAFTVLMDVSMIAAILLRLDQLVGFEGGKFAIWYHWPLHGGGQPPGFLPISMLSFWKAALFATVLTSRLLPGVLILRTLRTLLRAYANGLVFTRRNAKLLERVGWFLLFYAVTPFLTHSSLFLMHITQQPFSLQERQLDSAVIGAIVFAIAHVMALGCNVTDELKGIV